MFWYKWKFNSDLWCRDILWGNRLSTPGVYLGQYVDNSKVWLMMWICNEDDILWGNRLSTPGVYLWQYVDNSKVYSKEEIMS